MRYIWIVLVLFLFGSFVYFTSPLDKSVYDNYLKNSSIVSKGSFTSKRQFEVQMQIENNKEQNPDGTPSTNPNGSYSTNISGATGVAQCPWSNAAGASLSSDEFIQICRSKVGDADQYIQYFGYTPEQQGIVQEHNQDAWKSKFSDGVGTIHYFQGGVTPWANLRHKFHLPSHSSVFTQSGCGSTAMAIIFSTMMHRYITPSEIAAGIGTYNDRYGSHEVFHSTDASAGALNQHSRLELVFQDPKYNGASILSCVHESTIDKAKVDETLANGGMVMWVSIGRKSSSPVWASGSGHWVVIREHDTSNDTYLCADGANSSNTAMEATRTADPNTANPFSKIQAAAKDQVYYVTPGPGYDDFINSQK